MKKQGTAVSSKSLLAPQRPFVPHSLVPGCCLLQRVPGGHVIRNWKEIVCSHRVACRVKWKLLREPSGLTDSETIPTRNVT
jgi:hypothetical protein